MQEASQPLRLFLCCFGALHGRGGFEVGTQPPTFVDTVLWPGTEWAIYTPYLVCRVVHRGHLQ